MGYEEKEPAAVCDGCGAPLYEGDSFWDLSSGGPGQRNPIIMSPRCYSIRQCEVHYCCLTPCLEKAVVRELRRLHAASLQTDPGPNPAPLQGS
jgi:hypothetical protein